MFAYYDTKLIESYITGGIGQFLENFNESKRETVRSFRYKGVYFLAHSDARDGSYKQGEWISSPSVYLYSDGNVKAVGEATLGAADDGTYVWGEVDGTSKVDTDERIEMRHTLNQPEKPEAIGEPVISTVEAGDSKKGDEITKTRIQWETGEHSTPQLSYTVVLTDKSGNEIGRASGTRPEVREVSFPNTDPAYKCEVTVTDVFGKTTTATYTSRGLWRQPRILHLRPPLLRAIRLKLLRARLQTRRLLRRTPLLPLLQPPKPARVKTMEALLGLFR